MPQTTVAAIITRLRESTEQILLTRRNVEPFKGKWCLPGGHIDPYEVVREAVVREVEEETGLLYRPRFYGYFDEIMPDHGIHHVVIVFEGHGEGELHAQESEVSEMGWFSVSECRSLPLAFRHHDILSSYAMRQGRKS